MICFDSRTLFDYVRTCGDLYDPVTRQHYFTFELSRLWRAHGQRFTSFQELKQLHLYNRERQQLCDSFVNEIMELLRSFMEDDCDVPEASATMDQTIFPLLLELRENICGVTERKERGAVVTHLVQFIYSFKNVNPNVQRLACNTIYKMFVNRS